MYAPIKYTLSLLLLGFMANTLYSQRFTSGDKATFNEQNQHTLYVHPNPVSQQFYLQFPGTYDPSMKIRLIDLQGKSYPVPATPSPGDGKIICILPCVPAGFYIIECRIQRMVKTGKVVVKG